MTDLSNLRAELVIWMLAMRQADLMRVDATERLLRSIGSFKGPRTSELRKEQKSTRRE